jgi:PilZ domain
MPEHTDAEKDRRRTPRFSCGGEVKISRLPSNGVFLPGAIRDLSLGGCWIDTPLSIACGARTEMVVHVKTASFRVVGEVREIRGRFGAGIEFVHLSAGGRDMLAELVAELARLQAVMTDLTSAGREKDTEEFRKQLDGGNIQAKRLSKRLSLPGPIVKAGALEESLEKSSEPGHATAASESLIVLAEPLVIPVDLFG